VKQVFIVFIVSFNFVGFVDSNKVCFEQLVYSKRYNK